MEVSKDILFGDAHTHLDQYGPEEIPGILDRAAQAGVGFIICAGTTVESTRACIRMTEEHAPFYAGVGIHPMEAHQPVDEYVYTELESLAKGNSKVVCISEVGLDYMPTSPDHQVQDQGLPHPDQAGQEPWAADYISLPRIPCRCFSHVEGRRRRVRGWNYALFPGR